ncbi:MAG: Holliday junction resolvase RuvX [Chloroflexi bacterium]|nr:Holliday junction resolvase RuvX [Chloroflexota bacterium]
MALDLGMVRTGVAISDPTQTLATPLTVVPSRNPEKMAGQIRGLVEHHDVGRVVAGIPISLDGRRGPMARWAEGVCRILEAALPVSVERWDERFSSAEADARARDSSESGRGLRSGRDAVAAAIILQEYLDRHRHETLEPNQDVVRSS